LENNIHIKHIVEALNQDKLIIFVGAGVSKNSGLPDWSELIKCFKDELNIVEETDYLKIAQYYYDTFGQQKYLDKIVEILGKKTNVMPNSIHDEIFKLKPNRV